MVESKKNTLNKHDKKMDNSFGLWKKSNLWITSLYIVGGLLNKK